MAEVVINVGSTVSQSAAKPGDLSEKESVCARCGKEIGGLIKLYGYKCPSCDKVYCKDCVDIRNYLITKKAYCPECGKELIKYHIPR